MPQHQRLSVALCDETSPLLHDHEAQTAQPAIVPIPKGTCVMNGMQSYVDLLSSAQLGTLCFVRLVEPIAYVQIFPYINEFIVFLRITDDPSKTGFYSGLVVSFPPHSHSNLTDIVGVRIRDWPIDIDIWLGASLW